MKYAFIEKLIRTNYRLFALETKNPIEVRTHFRDLGRISGQSVYIWEAGKGLVRSDAAHIVIPNTQTSALVLQHIKNSKHPGHYVLIGFSDYIENFDEQNNLYELAKAKGTHKTLFLVDNQIDLPERLAKHTFQTKKLAQLSQEKKAKKLKEGCQENGTLKDPRKERAKDTIVSAA